MSVEHPPPWRWEIRRDGALGALLDASGGVVLTDDGTYDDAWIKVASPRVRELLRAAPELVAMLRRLTDVADGMTALAHNEYACKPDDFAEEFAAVKEAEALLDRIDKASKGGT